MLLYFEHQFLWNKMYSFSSFALKKKKPKQQTQNKKNLAA